MAADVLHQCRSSSDEHLMCPTCIGSSVEDCNSKQTLRPCRSQTVALMFLFTFSIFSFFSAILEFYFTLKRMCLTRKSITQSCCKHLSTVSKSDLIFLISTLFSLSAEKATSSLELQTTWSRRTTVPYM